MKKFTLSLIVLLSFGIFSTSAHAFTFSTTPAPVLGATVYAQKYTDFQSQDQSFHPQGILSPAPKAYLYEVVDGGVNTGVVEATKMENIKGETVLK